MSIGETILTKALMFMIEDGVEDMAFTYRNIGGIEGWLSHDATKKDDTHYRGHGD